MTTNESDKTCDCLSRIQQQAVEFVEKEKQQIKGFKIIKTTWQSSFIYPKHMLHGVIKFDSVFEKKDGTTSKPKSDTINIAFKFCPFCGVEIK